MRLNIADFRHSCPLYFEAGAIICYNCEPNHLTAPHPYQAGHSKRISLVHLVLEICHVHFMTTLIILVIPLSLFILGKVCYVTLLLGVYISSL
jgi:hypothetical protein